MGKFRIGNFELGKFRNGKISNWEFRTGNFELGKFRIGNFPLIIPILNALFLINILLILFILLPWLFVIAKFMVFEKIYDALSLIFWQLCYCQNEKGDNSKY